MASRSKIGIVTLTPTKVFDVIMAAGNNTVRREPVKITSIYLEYAGEAGSGKATRIVTLSAFGREDGTAVVVPLVATSMAADAVTPVTFTQDFSLFADSNYVNGIKVSVPAVTADNTITVKYIINYE